MTASQITEFVETQIIQAQDGANVENNKFDFKREWYDLTKEEGINEFLKDACAIINSYGGGDGFIVIGYDEKTKSVIDAPFAKSGFKNDTEMIGLVKKKIDRPFNLQVFEFVPAIEGNLKDTVSIIHFPPSLDKPHVIREYKKGNITYYNEIFIRKDKSCERASRADLDLMYAEKPSLQVDRKAIITFRTNHSKFVSNYQERKIFFVTHIAIENVGFKPFAINDIRITITAETPFPDYNRMVMPLHNLREHKGFFPVISRDQIHRFEIDFYFNCFLPQEDAAHLISILKQGIYQKTIRIADVEFILSNGEILKPQVTTVDH